MLTWFAKSAHRNRVDNAGNSVRRREHASVSNHCRCHVIDGNAVLGKSRAQVLHHAELATLACSIMRSVYALENCQ